MKHTLIVAVFIVLLVAVFTATSIGRWQTVEATPLTDLKLGMSAKAAYCYVPSYFSRNGDPVYFCESKTDDGMTLYITADMQYNIIKLSVWIYPEITVGELIRKYGDPIGAEYGSNSSRYIYWKDFSAYVAVKNRLWTANSAVYYVSYGERDQDTYFEEWQGFKVK